MPIGKPIRCTADAPYPTGKTYKRPARTIQTTHNCYYVYDDWKCVWQLNGRFCAMARGAGAEILQTHSAAIFLLDKYKAVRIGLDIVNATIQYTATYSIKLLFCTYYDCCSIYAFHFVNMCAGCVLLASAALAENSSSSFLLEKLLLFAVHICAVFSRHMCVCSCPTTCTHSK